MNTNGQIMWSKGLGTQSAGFLKDNIDLNELTPGTYLLRIRTDRGDLYQRLIKQ